MTAQTYTQPTLIGKPPVTVKALSDRDKAREDIRVAIEKCAADHDTLIHASWLRPYLPTDLPRGLLGSMISDLKFTGVLADTRRPYLDNGDGSNGNRTKPCRVRKLTKPIPRPDAPA